MELAPSRRDRISVHVLSATLARFKIIYRFIYFRLLWQQLYNINIVDRLVLEGNGSVVQRNLNAFVNDRPDTRHAYDFSVPRMTSFPTMRTTLSDDLVREDAERRMKVLQLDLVTNVPILFIILHSFATVPMKGRSDSRRARVAHFFLNDVYLHQHGRAIFMLVVKPEQAISFSAIQRENAN